MKKSRYFLLILGLLMLQMGGCSKDSISDNNAVGTGTLVTTTVSTVATITVTATPATSLSALGTAAIAATLKDSAGANVSDGTAVTFSITTNSTLGTVSATATTVNGVATSTFTAGATAGTVVISVAAGSVTTTVSLAILGVDVGSIEFTKATPDVIGVKGSGQQETSVITFTVKDINGQLATSGTNVTFALNGPNGGEILTPLTASTQTGGIVTTTLQSGSVAGPVRITATTIVSAVPISTSSTGVSIGGGKPSIVHMTPSRTIINLSGLTYVNLVSTVSTFLADRFGNFNILKGTSVSFFTVSGAIDTSNVTDTTGSTSVTYRTQLPDPLSYSTANPFSAASPSLTGNPVNGHAMVITMTQGEECFVDKNGNGTYQSATDGFPSSCDISEPFVDENDNNTYDAASELFVDANNNGVFDVANGVRDADLMIWKQIRMAITGSPSQIKFSSTSFTVADGTTQNFTVCVADQNANAIMAGSTVALSTTVGTLGGGGTFVIPDILSGPYCLGFSLSDPTAGDTDPAAPGSVEVKVTWKVTGHDDQIFSKLLSGTVN